MKKLNRPFLAASFLALLTLSISCRSSGDAAGSANFHDWALKPPMGWNSWDCFGTTVTEALTKENADYMADKLAAHGWQYIVVDIQWYEPQSKGWDYTKTPHPVLDAYGRLLPVVGKFPSSANGQGFKPLAAYIHTKGLKFGLHLLRGIPRAAVQLNTPILGTEFHARDIADTNSRCEWNPDMYGVDMSKPGAQAYYDSVFKLMASWGIDFVKVDDLSRPYHQAEIEGIRHAIDHCGRAIVFSTSPGATPLKSGENIEANANMWRITDDFWDKWNLLKPEFELCNRWTPYRGPGHWPDPDMLPLGALTVGPELHHHWTHFTPDEQRALLTLWCMARAPLIFGGHLPWNDAATLALITNDEVLALDQNSAGNRQLFRQGDLIAWLADVPGSSDRYLALFNAQDMAMAKAAAIQVSLADCGFTGAVNVRDLWSHKNLGVYRETFSSDIAIHGAGLYRLSASK